MDFMWSGAERATRNKRTSGRHTELLRPKGMDNRSVSEGGEGLTTTIMCTRENVNCGGQKLLGEEKTKSKQLVSK